MKFAVLLFWVPARCEIFTYAPLCGSKDEILNSNHGNHGEPWGIRQTLSFHGYFCFCYKINSFCFYDWLSYFSKFRVLLLKCNVMYTFLSLLWREFVWQIKSIRFTFLLNFIWKTHRRCSWKGESLNLEKLVSHVNFYVVNEKINNLFYSKIQCFLLSACMNREYSNFR